MYQNGQLGTPYPTKLLLFLFMRPHLLFFLPLPRGPTPRIRITNHEPRRCPNLSFILRFGKRLIHKTTLLARIYNKII